MGKKRSPILRELSFKFRHENSVFEARGLNYANNYWHNNKHGDIGQESLSEGPILSLNKRLK